jgi:hypothetical protein
VEQQLGCEGLHGKLAKSVPCWPGAQQKTHL